MIKRCLVCEKNVEMLATLREESKACICKGNWRLIVAESRPLFNNTYVKNGEEFTFSGVVEASDDYYYLMVNSKSGEAHLLSCVGSIEGHGFSPALRPGPP